MKLVIKVPSATFSWTMVIYLNVFCSCMKHWVCSKIQSTEILTKQYGWRREIDPKYLLVVKISMKSRTLLLPWNDI